MRSNSVYLYFILFVLFWLVFFNGKSAQRLQKRDVIITREYQFDVDMEGYYIYDGENYLGFVPYGTSPVLDSLINSDNQ